MPRKRHSHLTRVKRMHIAAGLSSGLTQKQIAAMVNVSVATISRELKRNRDPDGIYRGPSAHAHAERRRRRASTQPRKVTARHIDYLYDRMLAGESPDVISHGAPPSLRLSTPWIYEVVDRLIVRDAPGDDTFRDLLLRKYRRRRGPKRKAAGASLIPNRVDISERPAFVATRQAFGHWEADLVIGKGHRGALVTLAERKTRYLVSGRLRTQSKDEVTAAIIKLLTPIAAAVHTITFDNGLEFAGHERVAARLNCATYFAKPYRSYERGTNENLHGEIRRYYPKREPLTNLDPVWFEYNINLINDRRRKVLAYASARQCFDQEFARLRATEPMPDAV